MEQIIKIEQEITIGDCEVNAVNARDLWRALEVKKDYSSWIKRQIESLDLEENVDYVSFTQKVEREIGATIRKEYVLTLDAAKHIAMASKTPQGKKVRKYFIEVEKQWRQGLQLPNFSNPAEAARAWADEYERRMQLEHKVKQDAPKVEFAESVEVAHNSLLIGQFAKAISTDECKIGQNRLFEWLRNKGYLIKSGARKNMPTQKYLELGYFEVVERAVENPDGSIRVTVTTKITGKGQVALTHLIKRDFCNQRPE